MIAMTERQRAFIESLLREHSDGSYDTAQRVRSGNVTKREASAIIDRLLAAPRIARETCDIPDNHPPHMVNGKWCEPRRSRRQYTLYVRPDNGRKPVNAPTPHMLIALGNRLVAEGIAVAYMVYDDRAELVAAGGDA